MIPLGEANRGGDERTVVAFVMAAEHSRFADELKTKYRDGVGGLPPWDPTKDGFEQA